MLREINLMGAAKYKLSTQRQKTVTKISKKVTRFFESRHEYIIYTSLTFSVEPLLWKRSLPREGKISIET